MACIEAAKREDPYPEIDLGILTAEEQDELYAIGGSYNRAKYIDILERWLPKHDCVWDMLG